ncbi:ABC transporter permease [Streptomyces sp. enrichment culture]|uniref:ABC transporter permease n=1 Tax=Streptomyces sp. enrichment culture TaxID=1795815 RepID=UPI003F55C60C
MTTVTENPTPTRPAVPTGDGGSWAAVFALARFETRRLLLRVPVLVALALYVSLTVWSTRTSWDGFPALQDADRATQNGPLLVGFAVLLCVNQAMLRDGRHDTERHLTVLVLPRWRRTLAHLLSVGALTLVTAGCVAAQFTWEALKPGAVGHGSPGELLVGPLCVLLLGSSGALLARLVRSALAAPLLIVLCLFFGLFSSVDTDEDSATRWLMPLVAEGGSHTLPSELIGRPAAWHALYLAGLGLTLAFAAVLLSGAGRVRTLRAASAGAVLLTLAGAVGQAGGVSPETKDARTRYSAVPQQVHECTVRDGVRYCAFPEWTARTGDWADALESVTALAGDAAADRPLVVRQRVEARYGLTGDSSIPALTRPGEVTVGTSWGGNRVPEFTTAVAGVLVAGTEKDAAAFCDGRTVTVMWLALAGRPDPVADLRRVRLDDSDTGSALVISQTEPTYMTAAQTEVVRALLDRPRAEVAEKVRANWRELTAPKVTTDRVAEVLGLPSPEGEDTCL